MESKQPKKNEKEEEGEGEEAKPSSKQQAARPLFPYPGYQPDDQG